MGYGTPLKMQESSLSLKKQDIDYTTFFCSLTIPYVNIARFFYCEFGLANPRGRTGYHHSPWDKRSKSQFNCTSMKPVPPFKPGSRDIDKTVEPTGAVSHHTPYHQ